MSMARWAPIPVLGLLAIVLLGAAPSAGDRIAGAAGPTTPPVPVAACGDDSAILVASGGGAEGAVFRCAGGIPVPRRGPWSTPGCDAPEYQPEVTLLATPGEAWQPATACLIATPAQVVPVAEPATRTSGR